MSNAVRWTALCGQDGEPHPGDAEVVGRMRGTVERPEGLQYVASLLSTEEERDLLLHVTRLQYDEVRMHGQVARRVVRHYGVSYDFDSAAVREGEPLPPWMSGIRERCAELAGRAADHFVEALVTRYPPGATIGWHRDAPQFGDVVGLSLLSTCLLRFQRGQGPERRVFEQLLEPRSAYLLTGPARTSWQHSIPAVAQERYSLTFRTLRRAFRQQAAAVRTTE